MKTCTKCKIPKEESHFTKRTASKDGLFYRCRECDSKRHKGLYWKDPEASRELNRRRRKENPERGKLASKKYRLNNPNKARERHFESKYGISLGERDTLIKDQKGVCGICGFPPGKRGLVVDHRHATRKVRALLCQNCNLALGLLRDSFEIAHAASEYLKKHS